MSLNNIIVTDSKMTVSGEQTDTIQSPSLFTEITAQKNTIHQVTTTLTTSKNVLFPGHNHLLTIGTDRPNISSPENQ